MISSTTLQAKEQNEKSHLLIKNSVKISSNATEKLNLLIDLSSKNHDDTLQMQDIIQDQLKNSALIKSKISGLLDNSQKAISGSLINIGLGNELMENIKSL